MVFLGLCTVAVRPALRVVLKPGSVLVEAHDEWQVADKRYLSETTLALLNAPNNSEQNVAAPAGLTA